jgi:Tfp pilus assembly protein PilV
MLEVLVAMMVVFLTFMTSLNGLLYAAMFQVKGDRQAQAVYWIQQDVEQIKSLAASTASPPAYTTAATCTTATPSSCCTTTVSSGTVTGGFANALRTSSSLPTLASKTFFGKDYTMTRTPSVSSTNPQVLIINYTVRNASDTSDLATLYTEILPAAALSCS